jgi:stage V sporulation protein SpoVS
MAVTHMSDFLELEMLDHTLRSAAYAHPATVYVALYSSDPGEGNTGNEIVGNGYAREVVAFDAASGSKVQSNGVITFDTATGANWLEVTHFGIFDQLTLGNLLFYAPVDTPRTVNVGDHAEFADHALVVDLSDAANAMTEAACNNLLNFVLRNTDWSPPGHHVALYTTAPTRAGGGTEVATAGTTNYVRQDGVFHDAASGACRQNGVISYAAAGAGGYAASIKAIAITDGAATADDIIYFWTVTNVTVEDGDIYSIADDTIVIGMD